MRGCLHTAVPGVPTAPAAATHPPLPCRRADPPRSILGLPIISCRSPRYALWALMVLLLDLTYSAFLLPLSISFQASSCWRRPQGPAFPSRIAPPTPPPLAQAAA